MSKFKMGWRAGVLAVAGAAALGFGGMASAGASVNSTTHVFTKEEAGFQASSLPGDKAPWHYRYVQAQLSLPDVTGKADQAAFPGGVGFSTRLTDAAETAVLGISTTPASGVYNFAFALEGSDGTTVSCVNGNSLPSGAGDTVAMSLYFTGKAVQYNGTDKTTGKVFSGSCSTPNQAWTSVQVGDEFATDAYGSPSGFTPPSGNLRLGTFTSTAVTSRTGIRGSIGSAPWPVQNLVMTSDGTSGGTLDASTPLAWGSYAAAPDTKVRDGRNFSVWLPSNPNYPVP
jgi:hypothetical protein